MGFYSFTLDNKNQPIRNAHTSNPTEKFFILLPSELNTENIPTLKNIEVAMYTGYGTFLTKAFDAVTDMEILLYLNFDQVEQNEFSSRFQVVFNGSMSDELRCKMLDHYFNNDLKLALRFSTTNIPYSEGRDTTDAECQGYF